MDMRDSWRILIGAWAIGFLSGCTESITPSHVQPPSTEIPIGIQMERVDPQLAGHRFINLLSFESPTDTVFVFPLRLIGTPDSSRAHTGHASLRLVGDGGKMVVKLASLVSPQQFPGSWTFAGAYFYSEQPARVMASLDTASPVQNIVDIPAGQWTPVLVELPDPANRDAQAITGIPALSFTIGTPGDLWCDDVMLGDNTHWLVGRPESAAKDWTVYRRGSSLVFGGKDFHLELPDANFKAGGWILEEANVLRARLKSGASGGTNQILTIYPDGRSYVNGNFRPLSPPLRTDLSWRAQQLSPAEIQVPEAMGRVNRNSPGDEDNDGYNEMRASYMIIASGPRLEATIIPRTVPVQQPMLEITGLPPGDALVTVEGRLVERTQHLPDGTLLIELPGRIDRPTTVNIAVK